MLKRACAHTDSRQWSSIGDWTLLAVTNFILTHCLELIQHVVQTFDLHPLSVQVINPFSFLPLFVLN